MVAIYLLMRESFVASSCSTYFLHLVEVACAKSFCSKQSGFCKCLSTAWLLCQLHRVLWYFKKLSRLFRSTSVTSTVIFVGNFLFLFNYLFQQFMLRQWQCMVKNVNMIKIQWCLAMLGHIGFTLLTLKALQMRGCNW